MLGEALWRRVAELLRVIRVEKGQVRSLPCMAYLALVTRERIRDRFVLEAGGGYR